MLDALLGASDVCLSAVSFQTVVMVQHKRVFKVLVCLVGSMIATTALLDWIDPSLPTGSHALRVDQIRRFAQAVVQDDLTVSTSLWTGVELRANPLRRTSGAMLVASADRRDWHFRVTESGRAVRGARWARQQPLADLPGTISIAIDSSDGSTAQNPSQLACVSALLSELNGKLRPNQDGLPVSDRFE